MMEQLIFNDEAAKAGAPVPFLTGWNRNEGATFPHAASLAANGRQPASSNRPAAKDSASGARRIVGPHEPRPIPMRFRARSARPSYGAAFHWCDDRLPPRPNAMQQRLSAFDFESQSLGP